MTVRPGRGLTIPLRAVSARGQDRCGRTRPAGVVLGLVVAFGLFTLFAPAARAGALEVNADELGQRLADAQQLPTLGEGVHALEFKHLYRMPVGPAGLEWTDEVRALAGSRVRLLGFMVRQERPAAGVALLAPFPLSTDEEEYGLCDDLPPTVVFVDVPRDKNAGREVPFTPGPLLLTGRLELGAREEADGRISHVRIVLEEPPAGVPADASAAPAVPVSSHRH